MIDLRLAEDELEDRRERITAFIDEQCASAGVSGVAIGLSGGIDSSLTAALAVEALGAEAVYGISMPAAVSADRHQTDAERIAEQLGIGFDVAPVEPAVESIISARPGGEASEFARGNARARVRAVLTYLIANDEDRLVLGTGNRTEALVGYFTKYGDGAVDCNPIGNLYKCQVRQLARHVGIPEDIVSKTPTAELWADQTDEEELGIEYDTLDRILALHVDGPLSVAATAKALECGRETVQDVDSLVRASAHKRSTPPQP